MTKKIRYRPHHFLCSVGWQGMGYSKDFSLNMDSIVDGTLRAAGGDSTIIEVVKYTDDICSPCPHRREKLCEKQETIEKIDNAHSKKLGLKIGKNITWGDAKKLIRKNYKVVVTTRSLVKAKLKFKPNKSLLLKNFIFSNIEFSKHLSVLSVVHFFISI